MNIFITSPCPVQSAKDHNNIHCTKMCTESMQLLSTAHSVLDGQQVGYKPTHRGHPSAVWCRESTANYQWLHQHATALCEEYTFRTGKVHKSSEMLSVLAKAPSNCPVGELTEIKRAMPDAYILLSLTNPYKSYQAYLNAKFHDWQTRTDKKQMPVAWTKRNAPDWYVSINKA